MALELTLKNELVVSQADGNWGLGVRVGQEMEPELQGRAWNWKSGDKTRWISMETLKDKFGFYLQKMRKHQTFLSKVIP